MVPKLPIELVDCIIDEVAHISLSSEYPRPARKRDLGSCALVCRDWLYRSRQNLFHSIRITGARDIRDLKNTLDKLALDGRTVHDLSICHEEVLHAYDPMQLSQALSYLTALRFMDVEFVNLGFPAHSYHVKHAPLPLSKLRRLTLTWVAAKTFASFILLIEAFPCLTHLILSDCSVRVVPEDDDCIPPDVEWTPRLPQLCSVKLIHADTYMPLAALQRWISISPLFSSLIKFTLSPGNDLSPNLYRLKEAKSTAVLLKRRGNMLQKLRLNAFLFDRYWISDICIGLQDCTSLQKFSFTPAYWDAAQVLLIDRALQQLHSPSLTHLSFSFRWCSAAEPEQRARGTALGTILDDRFSTDPFRNLMKVTIKIQIFGDVPSNAEITQYFPRTLKRGILRLEIEREPADD